MPAAPRSGSHRPAATRRRGPGRHPPAPEEQLPAAGKSSSSSGLYAMMEAATVSSSCSAVSSSTAASLLPHDWGGVFTHRMQCSAQHAPAQTIALPRCLQTWCSYAHNVPRAQRWEQASNNRWLSTIKASKVQRATAAQRSPQAPSNPRKPPPRPSRFWKQYGSPRF